MTKFVITALVLTLASPSFGEAQVSTLPICVQKALLGPDEHLQKIVVNNDTFTEYLQTITFHKDSFGYNSIRNFPERSVSYCSISDSIVFGMMKGVFMSTEDDDIYFFLEINDLQYIFHSDFDSSTTSIQELLKSCSLLMLYSSNKKIGHMSRSVSMRHEDKDKIVWNIYKYLYQTDSCLYGGFRILDSDLKVKLRDLEIDTAYDETINNFLNCALVIKNYQPRSLSPATDLNRVTTLMLGGNYFKGVFIKQKSRNY